MIKEGTNEENRGAGRALVLKARLAARRLDDRGQSLEEWCHCHHEHNKGLGNLVNWSFDICYSFLTHAVLLTTWYCSQSSSTVS